MYYMQGKQDEIDIFLIFNTCIMNSSV